MSEAKRRTAITGPRAEALKARNNLLRQVAEHIVTLSQWRIDVQGYLPEYRTFSVGKSSYKIRNNRERMEWLLEQIKRNAGFTWNFKSHADAAWRQWKGAGCRPTMTRNSFDVAVIDAADSEKETQSMLENGRWRLEQYRNEEIKAEKTARDAINKQEEIKREIIQLETLHKAALINSSIARGEQAQFQEFLNDRVT